MVPCDLVPLRCCWALQVISISDEKNGPLRPAPLKRVFHPYPNFNLRREEWSLATSSSIRGSAGKGVFQSQTRRMVPCDAQIGTIATRERVNLISDKRRGPLRHTVRSWIIIEYITFNFK